MRGYLFDFAILKESLIVQAQLASKPTLGKILVFTSENHQYSLATTPSAGPSMTTAQVCKYGPNCILNFFFNFNWEWVAVHMREHRPAEARGA